jgi:glycogen synthase
MENGRLSVTGVSAGAPEPEPAGPAAGLTGVLAAGAAMIGAVGPADVIHAHTWYTHHPGCVLRRTHGAPLVLTTHSLEPHRPWKAEQLGAGYQGSLWLERTAYQNADGVIAVSRSMKRDVIDLYGVDPDRVTIIYNGIDDRIYRPVESGETVRRYGLDPNRPYALLVTRITRQKGIHHFLEAARFLPDQAQVLLCASSPDTPELESETADRVQRLEREGRSVVWVAQSVPLDDLVALYGGASVFVCPSVYEPFGIINLEAMACGTPVVASAVGGIPEVVVDGETGYLVPLDRIGPDDPEPKDPESFAQCLAEAASALIDNPELSRSMGRNGRRRVEQTFAWSAVAAQTLDYYTELASRTAHRPAAATG